MASPVHPVPPGRLPIAPAVAITILLLLLGTSGCSMAGTDPAVPAHSPASPAIQNVRYVDSVGDNYLFRGACPVQGETGRYFFNDDGLRAAIGNASAAAGKVLPGQYTLVDISLLWPDNPEDGNRERELLSAEQAFFASRPARGILRSWPTYGTGLDPTDPSIAPHREYLAGHLNAWLGDPLPGHVDAVRRYLEDPASEGIAGPVVVYVHCYGGCDRTGELVGAYSLRYLNLSWEEVRDRNGRQCRPDRAYEKANCNALQWYGLWLNATFHRPVAWDADPPCFRPDSPAAP